jgi:ATP-dependent Clp protease ATP-binding subunit ClpC
MQIIGATTVEEYRRHIERDAALERRFQSVMVGEPSREDACAILRGLRDRYEAHHRLRITDEAIEAAVSLSQRYVNDRYLPDKAIDLIDEAAAKKRLASYTMPSEVMAIENKLKAVTAEKEEAILAEDYENAASLREREKNLQREYDHRRADGDGDRKQTPEITEEDVAEIVTAWTGIPVSKLAETESDRLARLESLLGEHLIGQKEAVETVARVVRRGRAGLKDPRRPVGSLLFLGPTGVGKTELARALARDMYGGESSLIRVDMSEYMDKYTTSRMVGSPPGYVGYDDGGQLTEQVRRKPYSVVLFDEIEKAHPDVFHLLLQILEDGMLTDARGRRVDFCNTVIIMTSNVGAAEILEPRRLGFSSAPDEAAEYEQMKDSVRHALERTFPPEFLNRIDEIITFSRLTEEDLAEIASRMLAEVTKRIAALGISVRFSREVAENLARAGADPRYGARPLRRTLVRMVEDTFSEELLAGRIRSGDRVEAVWENSSVRYLCPAGIEK